MNAVEIKNLTKRLKKFTLDNISFTLPSGSILGLIGKNGSGKSTLIDILCTISRADEGEVSVLGTDIKSNEFTQVKEHIGYVTCYQSFPYIFTAEDMNKILRSCYKTWNEKQFFNYLKDFNIDTTQTISQYSTGTLMSLQIAAALSHDTKLLVLDEATNGLDAVKREQIIDILMDFTVSPDHSVIISSHISSDLDKICDYIAYLDNGKLKFFGEKDALCDKYSVVKCNDENFNRIDKKYILCKQRSMFNVEALCETCGIPDDIYSERARIEDLILYTEKE